MTDKTGLAPAKPKSDFHQAMKSHGMVKGDGVHKRHPATDHYKGQSVSQARYRSKV